MADIIQFPRRLKVFDPDLTATMGNAYDKAMSTLDERTELVVRELIAKRIIRMAQSGAADPEFLCTSALSGFRKARHATKKLTVLPKLTREKRLAAAISSAVAISTNQSWIVIRRS